MADNTYHLGMNPMTMDRMRTNSFEFIVTDIDNILKAGADDADENARIVNAGDTLRFAVQSSSIPHFTQEVLSLRRGNQVIKAAGVPSFAEGTISIVDYVTAEAKDALMAWRNLSYNVQEKKVGLMKDYKKTCWLVERAPDFSFVRKWKIEGAWISQLSEDDYDKATGNDKLVRATVAFDEAYVELNDLID